jgi:hypothetical protein
MLSIGDPGHVPTSFNHLKLLKYLHLEENKFTDIRRHTERLQAVLPGLLVFSDARSVISIAQMQTFGHL